MSDKVPSVPESVHELLANARPITDADREAQRRGAANYKPGERQARPLGPQGALGPWGSPMGTGSIGTCGASSTPDPIGESGTPGVSSGRRPYVAIDIETTGTDESFCQILEVGAVIDDWVTPLDQLPVFQTYVYHDRIIGEPFALQMPGNAATLLKMDAAKKAMQGVIVGSAEVGVLFMRPKILCKSFAAFLEKHGIDTKSAVLAAGKNFAGFDRPFLEETPGWNIVFHHRVIDPAMMFWNPDIDPVPPSSADCKKRACIEGEVAHTAVEDCLDIIREVRFKHPPRIDPPGRPEDDIEIMPSKKTAEQVAHDLSEKFRRNGQYEAQRRR